MTFLAYIGCALLCEVLVDAACTVKNVAPFDVKLIEFAPAKQKSHGELLQGDEVVVETCSNETVFGAFRLDTDPETCSAAGGAESCKQDAAANKDVLPLVTSLGPYRAPSEDIPLLLGEEYLPERATEKGYAFEMSERLAQLLNFKGGPPFDTNEWMTPNALDKALGEVLVPGKLVPRDYPGDRRRRTAGGQLGWRRRERTFLEFLDLQQPQTYPEDFPALEDEETWQTPLVIRRNEGGLAIVARKKFNKDVKLGPASKGYLTKLQHEMVATYAVDNSVGWPNHVNPKMITYNDFFRQTTGSAGDGTFHKTNKTPFNLHTPASSPLNLEVQSRGVPIDEIEGYENVSENLYGILNPGLKGVHFFAEPSRPRLGCAGTLRGLMFHRHQAALNEPLVGRKIFAVYPPRRDEQTPGPNGEMGGLTCPWPPWEVRFPSNEQRLEDSIRNLGDTVKEEGLAVKLTQELFERADEDPPMMRNCSKPMTALQWFVFELPKLETKYRPMIFMVGEGEAVWIPDSWEHLTINVDDALWVYMTSSDGRPDNLPNDEQAKKNIASICRGKGLYCEGYCGHWCKKCNGRKTKC